MKRYVTSKLIKWGFIFWFHCDSKAWYLYEMDLGRKESTKYNLEESVALNLATSLNGSYCILLFNNFFSSPNLIQTLFEKKHLQH